MVPAQVLGKSSSPMVLQAGNWWEALQNRYISSVMWICFLLSWVTKCLAFGLTKMLRQHQEWIEDLIIRLLCVFALDRFGDFVSDEVGCLDATSFMYQTSKQTSWKCWISFTDCRSNFFLLMVFTNKMPDACSIYLYYVECSYWCCSCHKVTDREAFWIQAGVYGTHYIWIIYLCNRFNKHWFG